MVRITKVYTKAGDKGVTQVAGGRSLSKTSLRIRAIGDVDELNAFLGLAAAGLASNKKFVEMSAKILRIQNELFNLGAQLAVLPENRRADTPMISGEDVVRLENEIDAMNKRLPHLHSFVLPGNNELAARLHVARAICRRAERSVIALNESEKLDADIIPFLNRLSDWLFVVARIVVVESGDDELLWETRG